MKKNLFRKMISAFMVLWLLPLAIFAQTYICEIRNDVQVSPTEYTFDVYIVRTGATVFECAGVQAGFTYNTAVLPSGATLTATIVDGISTLNVCQQPKQANLSVVATGIKMTLAAPQCGAGLGTVIQTTAPGNCVTRIKLTSTLPFVANSQFNINWAFSASPWPSKVFAYLPAYTNITVNANHVITNRNNPLLNPPPCTETTWTGTLSNDWATAGNWSACVPTSTTNVTIPFTGITNFPTISSSASCANLSIASGATLLDNGFLTVNGTASVGRSVTPGKWHLISLPVTTGTANIFLSDYLQSWSEPGNSWSDIYVPSTPLSPKQGYGLWNTSATSYTFTGALNFGIQSIPVTYTASSGFHGFNLLGNPYVSALDWATLNSTYGAVYVWNGTGYYTWNGSGDPTAQYIAPAQGFFILTSAPGTFTLNNSNRTHHASTFYKSQPANSLVLETESQGYSDKLYVSFDPSSTQGFDQFHDAYKFMSNTANLSQLYSYAGDKKLAIDVRSERETIQLGFTNDKSGDYQIGLSDISGISEAYLEDTKTASTQNLLEGSYKFTYTAGESDKRFLLHFSPVADGANVNVYSYQHTVYVNFNQQVKGDIYIYNMAGQLVSSRTEARGSNEIKLSNTGVYNVKVITSERTVVNKVFIQ
jgi:hypothetical protein